VFGEYTLVSTKIVRRDGLSLGYGFVEFATVEEAGKAIRRYQNLLLDEHNL
jgi:RNA recognition motif-containing protein